MLLQKTWDCEHIIGSGKDFHKRKREGIIGNRVFSTVWSKGAHDCPLQINEFTLKYWWAPYN